MPVNSQLQLWNTTQFKGLPRKHREKEKNKKWNRKFLKFTKISHDPRLLFISFYKIYDTSAKDSLYYTT